LYIKFIINFIHKRTTKAESTQKNRSPNVKPTNPMARKKGGASGTGTSGAAGGSAGGADDVKREQKLQAVLLADAFMRTFRPITFERPKVRANEWLLSGLEF
jgi:hypothetical protein